MRKAWRTGWRIAAAAIFIALAVRFVWITSTTETGWGLVRVTWQDAALDWAGLGHEVMYNAPRKRQAEFLLAQSQRVLADHPNASELVIGAAWMLDAPGFASEHRWPGAAVRTILRSPGYGGGWWPGEPCHGRSADVAARSTDATPPNKSAWRARVLLARTTNLTVLADASRHDPNNALYDYLAAVSLWRRSSSLGYLPDDEPLSVVVDAPDRFQQALVHFQRAQSKPFLAFEHRAQANVGEFLKHTPLPRHEHAQFQLNCDVDAPAHRLLQEIAGWQSLRIRDALRGNNVRQAWQLAVEFVHVTQQLDSARECVGYCEGSYRYHRDFTKCAHRLVYEVIAHAPHGQISATDVATLRANEYLAELRRSAVQRLRLLPFSSPAMADVVAGVTTTAALEAFVLACAVAASCWLLSRLAMRGQRAKGERALSCRAHLIAWAAAATISVYFLALCAGGMLAEPEQEIAIISALVGLPVALVATSIYSTGRFGLRTLFAAMAAVALALSLAQSPSFADATSRTIKRCFMVLPRDDSPGAFGFWRRVLGLKQADPRWVALEWDARDGARCTVLLAVAAVALLSVRCLTKRAPTETSRTGRAVFAQTVRCVGRSATAGAIVALVLYLVVAPVNIASVERLHLARLATMRDHELLWKQVDKEIQPFLPAGRP